MKIEFLDAIKASIGLGNSLAIAISWNLNKSVFWAIFHGIMGWIYIVYYLIGNPKNDNINN